MIWGWLCGSGAAYCETCRKAARQTGKTLVGGSCEARCPDLMDGNAEAFEVLQACSTQARYAGMERSRNNYWLLFRILRTIIPVNGSAA